MVCHNKCTLAFSNDDSLIIKTCCIFPKGNDNCTQCGCSFKSHTHARIEYVLVEQETEAYKFLVRNLAKAEKSTTG